jgi:hypothetical protein
MNREALKFNIQTLEEEANRKYLIIKHKAHSQSFDVENYEHVLSREKVDTVSSLVSYSTASYQAKGRRIKPDVQVLR